MNPFAQPYRSHHDRRSSTVHCRRHRRRGSALHHGLLYHHVLRPRSRLHQPYRPLLKTELGMVVKERDGKMVNHIYIYIYVRVSDLHILLTRKLDAFFGSVLYRLLSPSMDYMRCSASSFYYHFKSLVY